MDIKSIKRSRNLSTRIVCSGEYDSFAPEKNSFAVIRGNSSTGIDIANNGRGSDWHPWIYRFTINSNPYFLIHAVLDILSTSFQILTAWTPDKIKFLDKVSEYLWSPLANSYTNLRRGNSTFLQQIDSKKRCRVED